jgi:hypothetical protein
METSTKHNGSVVVQFEDAAEKKFFNDVLGPLEAGWGDSGCDMRDLYTLEGILTAIVTKLHELQGGNAEDDTSFVEDEPERVYYEYDNRELFIKQLGADPGTSATVTLLGEEAAELYDKLEACKLQSHINTICEEYLNA